jgi:hypothetical protein
MDITSFLRFSREVILEMYQAVGIEAKEEPKEYGRLKTPAMSGLAP